MCLSVDFFEFFLLGFFQLLESVGLSFIRGGERSDIISLNMFSDPLYLFFCWNSNNMTVRYFAVVSLVSLSIALSSRSLIFSLSYSFYYEHIH